METEYINETTYKWDHYSRSRIEWEQIHHKAKIFNIYMYIYVHNRNSERSRQLKSGTLLSN